MGGQRSIQVSGLIIRFIALKSRAMYQYGDGLIAAQRVVVLLGGGLYRLVVFYKGELIAV